MGLESGLAPLKVNPSLQPHTAQPSCGLHTEQRGSLQPQRLSASGRSPGPALLLTQPQLSVGKGGMTPGELQP